MAAFDDFNFGFSCFAAFAPVWECVGVIVAESKTLAGFAVKAPFRLLEYDS